MWSSALHSRPRPSDMWSSALHYRPRPSDMWSSALRLYQDPVLCSPVPYLHALAGYSEDVTRVLISGIDPCNSSRIDEWYRLMQLIKSMLHFIYSEYARIISGSYQDHIRIISGSYQDHIRIISGSYQDHIRIISGSYQDHIRIIWLTSLVGDRLQEMTRVI